MAHDHATIPSVEIVLSARCVRTLPSATLAALALVLGGHVRVAEELGREVATPAQTRETPHRQGRRGVAATTGGVRSPFVR